MFSLLDVFVCPSSGYIYLLGVYPSRETVAVRVSGYRPYLFAHDRSIHDDQYRVRTWGKQLSEKVMAHLATERGELLGIDVVHQKLLFGYSRIAPYTLKLHCKSPSSLVECGKQLKKMGVKTYEHDKDLRLAFLREANLTMYGTITATACIRPGTNQQRFSRCSEEYYCNIEGLSCTPYSVFPPITVAAYDLETEGLNGDVDKVFQVSVCIREFPFQKGDVIKKKLVCTLPTQRPEKEEFEVIEVSDEKALIEAFVDIVCSEKVTLLCGWNNLGFDAPFLGKRAKKFRCASVLERLSFLLPHVCRMKLHEKSLDSSAFGTNHFFAYQGCHGLTEMDGLLMARKSSSLKLNSYSLNNVARELLSSAKDDVTYQDILESVRTRDPEKVYRVAKYCVQDSMLVLEIFEHLKDVDNAIVMASLTNVPLSYIAERGQCVKSVSLIFQAAYRKQLIWNKEPRAAGGAKYQGSTVIDSVTGLYTSPVAVMDFNSLYPSIMMAYGLSPETLVGTVTKPWDGNSDHLATYDNTGRLHVYIGNKTFAIFDRVDSPVIPDVLRHLIDERKRVRKEMATLQACEALRHSQLHAKQLALKIMANSIYGTCGFANGPLPVVEIAAATTAIGRMSIQKVKATLADLGHDNVIAGDTDSVMLLIEGTTVQGAIDKANELCVHLNTLFPPPMRIEFEKVYLPYLVLTKKRYAGLLWESATKPPKRDTKGIATKRRDFAPIVVKTVGKVIDLILWSQDVPGAVQHVQDVLAKVVKGEIPKEELVVRKELKKRPYDYATPTPHSTVAAKMQKRDPEAAPKLGERVPYVIVAGQGDVSSRAEDPTTVETPDVDFLYYVQNQLRNPVEEIFRAVGTDIKTVFSNVVTVIQCQQNKQRQITDFFSAPTQI